MKRLLVALMLAIPGLSLADAGTDRCVQKADHKSMSMLLVDLSDKISDIENFKKSMTVFQGFVRPSERLLVGISTDKVGDARILMDLVNPEQTVWVSKLKIQAQQRTFKECFNESLGRIEAFDQKFAHSAILETIGFSAKIFAADHSEKKRLFLYSDIMQNSPALSFYAQKSLETSALMSTTRKEQLVSVLENVEVLVAGIGSPESDKKVRELEKYWKAFFEAAKARISYFGPVFIISE
jgi:hypothetical protein